MATVLSAIGSSNTIGAAHLYATPAAWDAGANTEYADNLTGNDVLWDGALVEQIAIAGSWGIGGAATDANRYKNLRTHTGAGWEDLLSTSRLGGMISGAGIKIESGSSNISCVITEAFAKITGIVMQSSSASSATDFIALEGADCEVRNCYFRRNSSSGAGAALVRISNANRAKFVNNFVLHEGTSSESFLGLTGGGTADDDTTAPVAANNTFVASSSTSGGAASPRGTAISKTGINTRYVRVVANAFFGMSALFGGTATRLFTSGSGYNATQLTIGTTDYTDRFPTGLGGNKYGGDITGTWSSANNVFVNTEFGTTDLRAFASGILAGNGVRLQSITNDLDGYGNNRSTSRPWIGAWEDPSAASSIALLYHLLRMKK